jgi:hypothetical protein
LLTIKLFLFPSNNTRSRTTAVATALSAGSTAYGLLKLIIAASSSSSSQGGWAVAVVTLVFAGLQTFALVKLSRAVTAIASSGLFERLRPHAESEDLEEGLNDDDGSSGKKLSTAQLLKVLKPYFWPKGDDERAALNRLRSSATWAFVVASKVS